MKIQAKGDRAPVLLLTLLFLLTFLFIQPQKVHAEGASALVNRINQFDHGGQGILKAERAGDTVTVMGKVTGAVNPLYLEIDKGARVVWQADYAGSASTLISLSPEPPIYQIPQGGTFELAKEGKLVGSGQYTLALAAGEIVINGGEVTNVSAKGNAIYMAWSKEPKVTVNEGLITATREGGKAIHMMTATTLIVNGGTIRSERNEPDSNAIYVHSFAAKSVIKIKGGEVYAPGEAIQIRAERVGLSVEGGTVRATAPDQASAIVIKDKGKESKVTVTAGQVIAEGNGKVAAIVSEAPSTVIDVQGGSVTSSGGTGGTVWFQAEHSYALIRGKGRVENTGQGAAILADDQAGSKVLVREQAVVGARQGGAIRAPATEMTGGFIFAYGDQGPVSHYDGSPPLYAGDAIGCGWTHPGGSPTYLKGSSRDLTCNTGASVSWDTRYFVSGIAYQKGYLDGFYFVGGVTVSSQAQITIPTVPTITILTKESSTTTTTTSKTTPPTTLPPTPEEATSPPSSEEITSAETSDMAVTEETTTTVMLTTGSTESPPADAGQNDAVTDPSSRGPGWLLIVLIVLGVLVIGLGLALTLVIRSKKKKPGEEKQQDTGGEDQGD